jgi:heterodisulfide reductase subunit A
MIAQVVRDKCAVCLNCVRACPFEVPVVGPGDQAAVIDPAKCRGCGICSGECPFKAIELRHFEDDQMLAEIRGALRGE